MDNENSSLIKDFIKFIELHKCEKGKMTHTAMGTRGGKFCFSGKNYHDFLDKYIKLVKSKAKIDLHFVERPSNHGVTYLLLDVDYDHIGEKRVYTNDHIKKIINKTNQFITENFDVTQHQLTTFLTEKPCPTKRDNKTMYKDGFHIYYPYLPMKTEFRYFVLDHLKSLMMNNELLENIEYKNDASSIFDTSVIKSNGILMIGSKKKNNYPYELTHVYDSELKLNEIDEFDEEELVYLLSNQKYDEFASIELIDPKIQKDIDKICEKYTSGNTCNKKENDNTRTRKSDIDKRTRNIANNRDIELAKKLVKILNEKRAHDFFTWRRVGFTLYSIDESLFDEFVNFSKRDMQKYNEGKVTCKNIWDIAHKFQQYYSIGSLRHWAKMDNEDQYYDIIRQINDKIFGKMETSKHVDIAQVIYELYKDRFVCIDISNRKWYEYQGHKWVFVESAWTLEELISDDIRKMMAIYCSEKMRDVRNVDDNFDHDAEYKRYMKLLKMIDNLADVNFRSNVVRACANKFYDPSFMGKLDSNIYLLGFLNGVYDLKERCFRDGLPTDYVSKTVGYEWRECDLDDPRFERIDKFLSEVQTEPDMKKYLMTFMASVLRGRPDQKVHIWTGGGGNGKSATVDLIKKMLGDYFGVVPVTLLTRKRGTSSSATPELADKFGKRFLVVQEPEHNDVVYVGQLKEYTGEDTILSRPLYGDPFYYVPQFTMVLTCNNLPHIPATDDGTWRRLRVTPFESQFVDENPDHSKRRFLKDEELQEEFATWAQPLMWLILTKYYKIYEDGINGKRYKIHEPEKVKQFTKNYKMDSDIYMEFLNDNIVKTNDDDDTEGIAYLYDAFKYWYITSYSEKAPARKCFIAYLKKHDFKIVKQEILGIKSLLNLS